MAAKSGRILWDDKRLSESVEKPADFRGDLRLVRAKQVLIRQIKEARHDPIKFFDFTFVSERTRQRAVAAPHQRVLLSFIHHPKHRNSVVILPPELSKSTSMMMYALFRIGCDHTFRGAVVSAAAEAAQKTVGFLRQMIEDNELNQRIRLVFPDLIKSERDGEPWTQRAITIDRPAGIRDPTMQAAGIDKNLQGSRLAFVNGDDLLNEQNTGSKELRDKLAHDWEAKVMSRVDKFDTEDTRVILSNTAKHPDDLLHRQLAIGWPTIKMNAWGGIYFYNADEDWDSDEIRPRSAGSAEHRLTANDPDPGNEKTLWEDKLPADRIERLIAEQGLHPYHVQRDYWSNPRDEETAMCKSEWIALCKRRARELGFEGMRTEPFHRGGACFTGVDLAFEEHSKADYTAFFTFEVLPQGQGFLILDIDMGRWAVDKVVQKIFDKQRQFGSVVCIEKNAGQKWAVSLSLLVDQAIPVRGRTTGHAKANPSFGVAGLFAEMSKGLWLIPNDSAGRAHPMITEFCNACLNYEPSKHTHDILMGCVLPGARVTTRRGLVPIEQVVIDDVVLTHKNRWRKVTQTTNHVHRGDVVRLKPTGGLAFSLTPDHYVWASAAKHDCVARTNRIIPTDQWGWLKAGELRCGPLHRGDFIEVAIAPEGKGCTVDLASCVPPTRPKATRWEVSDRRIEHGGHHVKSIARWLPLKREAAMLLGLYLAEGSVGGHVHTVSFALHRRETHLVKFITETMLDCFGARMSVRRSSENGIVVQTSSRIAARFFAGFGSGETKCLPWHLWHRMRATDRMSVARGWLMGDGCYTVQSGVGRLSGVSISRDLLEQIEQALRLNGMLPAIGIFQRGGPKLFAGVDSVCRDAWKVSLVQRDTTAFLRGVSPVERLHWRASGTPEKRRNVTDRTNTRQLAWRGCVLTRLTSSERSPYEGLVFNLHVEGDESYCVEGVAVHNSYMAREEAREMGFLVPPRQISGAGGALAQALGGGKG